MPTPNMGLVLPIDGGSPNVWNTILDQVFAQIDSHNHTVGQGVQVPVAGLNIAADLTFATNSAVHLKASVFDQVAAAAVAGYANALFVNSADANLYFRNAGGVNVQLTNGNTINVSLVGGIGGDYSTAGALVQYNDATRTYWLQQEGAPRPWAKLGTGDINLYQAAASIVNFVGIKSPAALAATYTLTMPAALPAATSRLYSDNAGNLGYVAPTVTVLLPPAVADQNNVSKTTVNGGLGFNVLILSGGVAAYVSFPVPLRIGDKILSATVYLNKLTANTTTITASAVLTDGTTQATTLTTVTNSGNAPGLITLPIPGINYLLAANQFVHVCIGVSAGAGVTDQVMGVAVAYTPGL